MRNYSDPEYKQARLKAKRRDRFRCRKCGAKNRLQVHHIKPYSTHPQLNCVVDNLITLCKICHEQMRGNESGFESLCLLLLKGKAALLTSYLLWLERKKDENDEI